MLVELAGLDIAESVAFLVRGDKSIPVRCGLIDLEANDGQMAVKTLVFDTEDSVVYGEGSIDLRDEKVNIVVLPVPKDFSPLSLRSYIRARGPLNNVSVFPDPIKTGTDSHNQKDFQRLDDTRYDPLPASRPRPGKRRGLRCLLANAQKYDPERSGPQRRLQSTRGKAAPVPRKPAQQHASRTQQDEKAASPPPKPITE